MSGMRVELDGVSRRYQMGGSDVWAVRDVSFTIEPGEFVAVIGRSGSGKTTLLNLIAGLERPSSGSIRLDGEEIGGLPEKQLTALRRKRIGFVFQSFGLLPLLSALENVELALRIAGAGRRERGRRAHEVLELMGLGRRLHHRPYELSGGEQQRVAIARAIANRPALILADEPTGELDSVTGLAIFRALGEIARGEGITILTSTHDRAVMELAERVEELADGHLVPHEQRSLLRYATAREGRDPALAGLHTGSVAPQRHGAGPYQAEAAAAAEARDVRWPALSTVADSEDADQGDESPDRIARWAAPARHGAAEPLRGGPGEEPRSGPAPHDAAARTERDDGAEADISRWAPPGRSGGTA
ncbi:MAG TPA: ABC transporter ATP-binding protein [Dehalococcoidia bacterium]|jgi:putative ABC transport system ATP-binding protein